MPSAKAELVPSIYAAWEHRDYGDDGWADSEIACGMAGGAHPGI